MKYLFAFLVGGTLCLIGQIFIDKTRLTPARVLVGFVVTGVLFGALGWYEKLVDIAGMGATVPLSGFGNLLATGTKEAVDKDGLLGAISGPLTAGSAGIMTAVLTGLVVSLFTKPKPK